MSEIDNKYLLPHGFYVLKRLVVGDGVDDDESLPVADVQVAHGSELLGAGSVEYFQDRRGAVHFDLLAVEVLNGGVVLLHKATSDKLDCQGALANTSRAEDNNFELPHLSSEGRRRGRGAVIRLGFCNNCQKVVYRRGSPITISARQAGNRRRDEAKTDMDYEINSGGTMSESVNAIDSTIN